MSGGPNSMNKLILALLFLTATALAGEREVPFGDKVNETIFNYNRTTPYIATSGEVDSGGITHLKELGFTSIVDLRTPAEGTEKERKAATKAGLSYSNIPIGEEAPDQVDLDQFQQWVENPDNHPVLVHCASANRVGTLWAMYRLRLGISLEEALLEGRTIGMKESRESQVEEFAGKLAGK